MLNKLKAGIASIKENKALIIPITASALNAILQRYRIEAIDQANVTIEYGIVKIAGTTKIKKFGFAKELDFTLHLKPVNVEKRTLQLELVKMEPIDFGAINNKLLQKPPVITYENRLIHVDLNAIEAVKNVPFGNIKEFTVEDGKILVGVGV